MLEAKGYKLSYPWGTKVVKRDKWCCLLKCMMSLEIIGLISFCRSFDAAKGDKSS